MTQQDSYRRFGSEISTHLLRGEFDRAAVAEDREGNRKYVSWYAELLSAMSLLVGSDPVVFAHTTFASDAEDFNVYVFTEHLFVVAKVDPGMDGVPVAQAISRTSLQSMTLSASERIDAQDGRSHEWPGVLNLRLTYRDLPSPIEVVGDGKSHYGSDEPSGIVKLIEGLGLDLARSHTGE